MPILHPPNDEGVDPLEVGSIQVGKAARIFLRGLNQQPFLLHRLYKLGRCAKGHGSKSLITFGGDIRNRRYANPLKFRLPDDVALDENSMVLQRLWIETPPKIAEVGEAIVPK